MKKAVGLGACVYDTLIYCDEYPREDTKLKAQRITVSGGGPVGNALVVMSKLGVASALIGMLADDNAGKYMIADFNKYGVDTRYVKTAAGKKSFSSYIILSEKEKTRTCVFDRGDAPDDPSGIDASAIESADVLHLDGNFLESAVFAANKARKAGVKVSLDAGGLYDGIEKLLPLVDILIPSAEFALGITGENNIPLAMKKLYGKYSPEVLAVTDGSRGGYYYNGSEAVPYKSFKVEAVDTNGAGDTFHGAFIAEYLNGKSVKECCEFASAVAAFKCTQSGVRTCPITRENVNAFIEANK